MKSLAKFSAFIVALLSVLGISAANLFAEAYKAHVALAVFVVTCLVVAGYAVWTMREWQNKKYPKGYLPVATFVRYSTTDGKQITHETFRQIQIKHAFLTKIAHRYNWTGSKPAIITSSLQQLGSPQKDPLTQYDVLDVKFLHPRYYNDTEIVHLRSTMDDSDEKSQTYCRLLIEYPTKLLQFRVELLHCIRPICAGMTAHIERRLQTAPSAPFELLESVKFNLISRSFEHLIANPESGFHYQIRWERPVLAKPKK
jgi:hypothetical protein